MLIAATNNVSICDGCCATLYLTGVSFSTVTPRCEAEPEDDRSWQELGRTSCAFLPNPSTLVAAHRTGSTQQCAAAPRALRPTTIRWREGHSRRPGRGWHLQTRLNRRAKLPGVQCRLGPVVGDDLARVAAGGMISDHERERRHGGLHGGRDVVLRL